MVQTFAREMAARDDAQLAPDHRQQPIQRGRVSGTPAEEKRRDVRIRRCHGYYGFVVSKSWSGRPMNTFYEHHHDSIPQGVVTDFPYGYHPDCHPLRVGRERRRASFYHRRFGRTRFGGEGDGDGTTAHVTQSRDFRLKWTLKRSHRETARS